MPGTLDVNIKDVLGSPTGALAVNLVDLLGNPISAFNPVPVRTDAGAIQEVDLIQVNGVTIILGRAAASASLPVALDSGMTVTPVTRIYLPVLQRPTFSLLVVRVNVIVAGGILIAAPGVGSTIVLRKVKITYTAAALAADVISMGTTLTGSQLAQWGIAIGAAATPDVGMLEMDWEDFAVGDNLPVDISSNVATFTNTSVMITYSVVTTANWPTA